MRSITDKLQYLWSSDEIIVLVLTSLVIQICLIFLAPLRKRSTKVMLTLALWLLYLTADNVATLALGNISKENPAKSGISSELTVLWAPFLLVHLGGPDSITSYSIEDNELWWRHLLGLVFQVIITVYVFLQSPPTGWLWIPTIFVFIPGLIKFAERTHALRLASKDNIKDKILSELLPGNKTMKVSYENPPSNAGPANQTTQGSEDNTTSNLVPANRTTEGSEDNTTSNPVPANQTTEGSEDNTTSNPIPANQTTEGSEDNTTSNPVPANQTTEGRLSNLKGKIMSILFPAKDTREISMNKSKAIKEGFHWFNIFKRLLVDVTFPADELMKSQDRFAEFNSTEALNLVAIELSFLYDILHTKAVHMHTKLGRVLRCFSLVSIIAALVVFHHLDMHKYASKDIIVTYILFGAGLSLEVIAIVLLVFSNWMVVTLTSTEPSNCFASRITAMVKVITFRKGIPQWANTIGHYNLVGVCLRDRDTKLATIMRTLKIKHIWDNICESKLIPLPKLFKEIMFTEAKRRAQNVHIYNVLLEARSYKGNKTLERHDQLKTLEWSMKREFDECIILWHLATDICYYGEKKEPSSQPNEENQEPSSQPNEENQEPSDPPMNGICGLKSCSFGTSKQPNAEKDTERDVSQKTSNYMIYLLTQQQSMMQLGYGKTRFEATCAVVKKKLKGKEKLDPRKARDMLMKDAAVSAEGSQPTNKMGTLVFKKIWAYLRCWGRRKRKDEEFPQVSEQTNASESADGSQPTNRMGTSVLKKIWANLRCWGRRKHKDEGAPQVSEQTNASESADGSQPTNQMGTSVLKKIWANLRWCTPPVLKNWGRRKREEDKRKREEENEMGELVLRDSRRLAKELQELKPEIKWKLISETWMEMLGYAAIHCDSYQHAKSLSRGGELLTHLWLLMSQLGVVEEHKMQQFESGSV